MNHAPRRSLFTLLTLAALLAGAGACGGCGGMKLWGGPTADVAITSAKTSATLKPAFTTVVYRSSDRSTIDVYLTDLPLGRLQDSADKLDGVSGTVVHIAMFLQPVAGKTPIDPTACSGSVRQLVLADGAMGSYGGGAFVTTADPGKETLSGTIRGGTVRLTRATPDFNDLLGPAGVEGKFTARYDESACRAIAQRLQDASIALPPIKTELK